MRTLLAVVLVAAAQTAAQAAESSASSEPEGEIFDILEEERQLQAERVVTASQKNESIKEAPGTVIVITEEDIRLRGYSNLADVLRDLPGMETNERYSAEIGTLVPVRGVIGNNKILVLVNGARVNPPGGSAMVFRSDFSVRHAKQIEIVYGPSSTMYGQDAISAVINVITKTPEAGHQLEAGANGGYPWGGEGWLAYRGVIGPAKVSAYAQYLNGSLTDIRGFDPQRYQLYEQVAQSLGSDTQYRRFDRGFNAFGRIETETASLQVWFRNSSQSSSEGLGPTFGRINSARWNDSSLMIDGSHVLKVGTIFQLDSRLRYGRFEIHPDTQMIFPNNTRDAWYLQDRKYGLDNSASLEEMFTIRVPKLKNFELVIIGGAVGKFFSVLPKLTVADGFDESRDVLNQQASVEYRLQPDFPVIRQDTAHFLGYSSLGGYLEATMTLFERLRLTGGIRADYDSRLSIIPTSPRAALGFDILPNLTVKYIFSMAYIAPSPYYAFSTWENARQISLPNPDLEAETSLSNEVNVIFREKWLYASASAFLNRNTNLLLPSDNLLPPNIIRDQVWVGNDPANLAAKPLTQSVNSGSSLVWGGELFLKFAVWKLQGWGSYSYVDMRQELAGIVLGLNQISHHNFRVGTTANILSNLSATVSFIARSRPAGFANDPAVPQYFLDQRNFPWEINLHVVYSPIKNFDLFVNVRNVTHNRYALKALYASETGDAMVKEGITAWLGARYVLSL